MTVDNYSNYMSSKDKQIVEEYRNSFQLTDRDSVSIYTLPKGKAGKKAGSFIVKPLTLKAQRLKSDVDVIKSRIRKIENSDLPYSERSTSLASLRVVKKYAESKFNAEIAALPRTGYILIEVDE